MNASSKNIVDVQLATEQQIYPRKTEYMVAFLLDSKLPNGSFMRWPLHITIVPWFEIDDPSNAIEVFNKVCIAHKPFSVLVGEPTYLGPRQTIDVNIIEKSHPLDSLHRDLIDDLETAQVRFKSSKYIGDNYQPHITKKSYARVQPGYHLKIKSLYFLEAPVANKLSRLKKVISVGHLN